MSRRLLSVIPAPTFGGAANQVLRLKAPLEEAGWEVVAVVPDEPGNVADRLRDGGVEVEQTPMRRARATKNPRPHIQLARYTRGDIRRLREIVRRHDADVVQNHGDLNPQAGIAGHREGRAVHWQLLDTRTPPGLRRVTSRLVLRLADSMSTVGRALAESYPGATGLGERCVTVFPPVDFERFAAARDREYAARSELGVPDGAICVGAIGNRNPQKGHDWLVRAVGLARRRQPELVVRILGAASPGHEEFEQGVRNEASRAGLSESDGSFGIVDPGARVAELIGGLDVLCMPSVPNSEGMPTTIFEAMAAGVPVVATDVGAVGEQIADGQTGRLVPPCDADSMAAAILDLADGGGEEIVAAAHERVRTEFSTERLRDLMVQCYELALAHRAQRRA